MTNKKRHMMKSFFQFYEHLKLTQEVYHDNLTANNDYIDAKDIKGKRVWVHTNRTNSKNKINGMIGIYPSTESGKKTSEAGTQKYTNEIRLKEPIVFDVDKKALKRYKDAMEKHKANPQEPKPNRELFSGVSGTVTDTNTSNGSAGMTEITFNPNEAGYYHVMNEQMPREIITAKEVYFIANENGEFKIFAKGIQAKEPEANKSPIIPSKDKPENLLFSKDSSTQKFDPKKIPDFYHSSKSEQPSGVVNPEYSDLKKSLPANN